MAKMEGALPDFLRKRKIYAQFVVYLHATYNHVTTRAFFKSHTDRNALRVAFDWTKTDEGFVYWQKINSEWQDSQ